MQIISNHVIPGKRFLGDFMNQTLLTKYIFAKTIVIDEGYYDEIRWQDEVHFEDITESTFLKELGWVILTSGMKTEVISKRFCKISECFYDWVSARKISSNSESCLYRALQFFNHKMKITAIIDGAKQIAKIGFIKLKQALEQDPINTLRMFKFIGPITAFHLAKNIGIPIAKPDRHLQRIADSEGYNDVQKFCFDIAEMSGDKISVVDVVLWRYATIDPDYLRVFSVINCS